MYRSLSGEKVSAQHFNQVKVWSLQHLDFCCCVWDHFPVAWANFNHALAVPQLDSGILWYTEELTNRSMTPRCPDPVAAKLAQTLALHHRSWRLVWRLCADTLCLVLMKGVTVHLAKHLHFGLIPKVLWFVQMQLYTPKPSCDILFWEKRLSPGNPSKKNKLVQSFSYFSNMLTKACRVWDVALGFCAISLRVAQSDLGVNLQGHPLLGRLTMAL